jgi:SulP family sulfate permease
MMMVENVPFYHLIAGIAIEGQGMGKETFATVFVSLAIGSLACGGFFYLLGHYELGNIVYFFPRHVIVGCIGGIGVFLFLTGMEGSANKPWEGNWDTIKVFFEPAVLPLWLASLACELLLRGLSHATKFSLLPPFFFLSIPPTFYLILLLSGTPIQTAHDNGWFFEVSHSMAEHLDGANSSH